MKSLRICVVLLIGVFLGLHLLSSIAEAQAKFPSRPIQFICPWGAGGGTDRVARMLAILLEKDLGQPVTVVNRTGGGGAVGHTAGATAAPDGHTITIVTVEIIMMHWMGLAKVNYKDFKPVGLVNVDPAGVNVKADAPWKTVKELLDYAKANPGKFNATVTGKGVIWDLARAGMLKAAGIPTDAIPWVPSEGAAPGLAEMVAGGVHVVTCSLPEARPMIEAKKVKALALMGDKRADLFPDVPTLKESGIPYSMGTWRGVGVPKDTPDDVVKILEKSLEKAVASAEYKDFMAKSGFGVLWKPSAEYGKYMAEGDKEMGMLMKEVGLVK
ncbi:MAG: tripartite tricarboxylate transporter substrate binding protein [Deltaproteobacteria bacterium]|nr:MAG: tripartite tricarboxylate transporter substrate binding protein [Deltaproteobacteria bacterium]